MSRILEHCMASGRKFKTIPGMADLIKGQVMVEQLREVNLEELLGRDPVRLDLESVQRDLAGKVVLVTGAAGSIGKNFAIRYYSATSRNDLPRPGRNPDVLFATEADTIRVRRSGCYCVADITDPEASDESFALTVSRSFSMLPPTNTFR